MAGALCASRDLVTKTFLPVLKSGGMTLAPFNAWVVLKGLETGHPHAGTVRPGIGAAKWLEAHPSVARVHYPGCPATRSMRWRWPSSRALAVPCFPSRSGPGQ
ncbi:MAG: PLP-dependent transferase [Burkholderiaceae bacterium]